jgi:hypothetical protein
VIALVSGIDGSYHGATRLGSMADQDTPMGDITIYQVGVGANYWQTKHAHFGAYYLAYVTPGSGRASNEAVVPDNLTRGTASGGHVLHEISARLAMAF